GKGARSDLHHPLVNERLAPYGLLNHRHTPEMQQVLGAEILFTPHLAPVTRGILATCYARATPTSPLRSSEEAVDVLREAYSNEPFVNVTDGIVSTADAYGSNVAHLTARADPRTGWVVVLAAIDNLVKGGSGQAIQAANLALGLPETAGLPLAGLAP
ncbi:MAG TPA: Asd/ArgC dimerization domain-containing protein, partial [Acidimicrobiales bacterium]|nr:Asd/ArgC dimerization domain-containing protein [Acidimicrobiales bacterium]